VYLLSPSYPHARNTLSLLYTAMFHTEPLTSILSLEIVTISLPENRITPDFSLRKTSFEDGTK